LKLGNFSRIYKEHCGGPKEEWRNLTLHIHTKACTPEHPNENFAAIIKVMGRNVLCMCKLNVNNEICWNFLKKRGCARMTKGGESN
jgi:hypothetical protein